MDDGVAPLRCPVAHDYNPFSSQYLADPYPLLHRMRGDGPVAWSPEMNAFLVTRYDEISKVFEDRDTYRSENPSQSYVPVCPEAAAIMSTGFPRKPTLSNCDPPRHPKMRQALSRCLTPRRWAKTQPAIRDYANQLVDDFMDKPLIDLSEAFAFPLPVFAAFTLIGFPLEDIEKVKAWCGYRVLMIWGNLEPAHQVTAAHHLVDFWSYCRGFVQSRIETPQDDLTSDLLALSRQLGEDELSVEDIINMVYSVSLAAHETSTAAILNGVATILTHREQWDELCADPSLIPNAVEELFRLNSPTQALRRLTSRDSELGGVEIPKGSTVYLLLGAAHYDGGHFEKPEAFDIRRENARDHLAFGKMWHFCLGAPLARFEYVLALELLASRTPDMRLADDPGRPYPANMLLRSPERLLVHPRPAA